METELDFEEEFIHDDDDLSSDSDVAVVTLEPSMSADAIDSSYLVSSGLKTSKIKKIIHSLDFILNGKISKVLKTQHHQTLHNLNPAGPVG